MSQEELRAAVMSYANRFIATIGQAATQLEQEIPSPEGRMMAAARKVYSLSAAAEIAASPNPGPALLDLVVMTTLNRMVWQDHWRPQVFGMPATVMLDAFFTMEEDVWRRGEGLDVDLYHTVAMVRVKDSCSVGMLGEGTDLELPHDVDELNFKMLEPGTRLGYSRARDADCVSVHTDDRALSRSDFLVVEDGEMKTARPVMPAMLTTDCDIIRMDCLCYLMERVT